MIATLQIVNLIISGLTFIYLWKEHIPLKPIRMALLALSFISTIIMFGSDSWAVVVLLTLPFFAMLKMNTDAHNLRDL